MLAREGPFHSHGKGIIGPHPLWQKHSSLLSIIQSVGLPCSSNKEAFWASGDNCFPDRKTEYSRRSLFPSSPSSCLKLSYLRALCLDLCLPSCDYKVISQHTAGGQGEKWKEPRSSITLFSHCTTPGTTYFQISCYFRSLRIFFPWAIVGMVCYLQQNASWMLLGPNYLSGIRCKKNFFQTWKWPNISMSCIRF